MGARAESQPSRGLERGGYFCFLVRGLNSHLSLTVSHSLCRVTHNTSVTHTSHGTHSRVPASRAALRASVSPQFPPPPRTVRCDAHTRSSLYSLTLSELLKDSKNTRGDPRGRATERVRRRHPTPTTGATRGGTPRPAPLLGGGAGSC
jgi:hypothetical protein